MTDKPRFNFENTNIGDGNVFGDNSSSNVQKVGRDEFLGRLSELRSAVIAETALDEPTRRELLQHVQEAELEAQKSNSDPRLLDKSLGLAKAVVIGALSKTVADATLIPLIHSLSNMAHHLF